MRKNVHIRIRLDDAQAHQVHQICLQENRSQSNLVSNLVSEALIARRKAAAENDDLRRAGLESKLVQILKGVGVTDAAS